MIRCSKPGWNRTGLRMVIDSGIATRWRVGLREFLVVDPAEGTRLPAFDHAKLADVLTRATGTLTKPTHLPFDRIAFPQSGSIVFEVESKLRRYDIEADRLEPTEPFPSAPEAELRANRRPGEGRTSGTTLDTEPGLSGRQVAG